MFSDNSVSLDMSERVEQTDRACGILLSLGVATEEAAEPGSENMPEIPETPDTMERFDLVVLALMRNSQKRCD
jgi:hypothetical protein